MRGSHQRFGWDASGAEAVCFNNNAGKQVGGNIFCNKIRLDIFKKIKKDFSAAWIIKFNFIDLAKIFISRVSVNIDDGGAVEKVGVVMIKIAQGFKVRRANDKN